MAEKDKGRNRLTSGATPNVSNDAGNGNTLTGTPCAVAEAQHGREGWWLTLTCPHCGERHLHGGGDGEAPDGGHRVAHCRNLHGKSYFIEIGTIAGEATA